MPCSVDRQAVLKILLHSAKYPAASINGILVGTISISGDEEEVHIIDAYPLFHSFLTLAPSLEAALCQVGTGICSPFHADCNVGMLVPLWHHQGPVCLNRRMPFAKQRATCRLWATIMQMRT